MSWQTIKQNIVERFMWFDVAIAVIQVAYCLMLAWFTLFDLHYAIQAAFFGASVWGVVHGLYQIFSNPVKQQIAIDQLVEQRKRDAAPL